MRSGPVRGILARMNRTASLVRKTRETDIALSIDLDGTGKASIDTGIPFFDHMLELLARHSLVDLDVKATGDIAVDYHHTVEDVGLALGDALNAALCDRKGIERYGFALLPMDETLARVALDLGGRPYLVLEMATRRKFIRTFDLGLLEEFMRAFSTQARMNLHIAQLYGKDPHHAWESVFKGLARALRMAVRTNPREPGIPSSKGVL